MMLRIKYSCAGCGLRDVEVEVPARGPGQDVVEWVESLRPHVHRNHQHQSPGCPSPHCDLWIPMPKDEKAGIGFPPTVH